MLAGVKRGEREEGGDFSFASMLSAMMERYSACARAPRATLPCLVCSRMQIMVSRRSQWVERTMQEVVVRERWLVERVSCWVRRVWRRVDMWFGRVGMRVRRVWRLDSMDG